MRTREKYSELREGFAKLGGHTEMASLVDTLIEVSLDCRDLLSKLVEKKSRKVISTEVSMSDSEQKLLDGLDVIES